MVSEGATITEARIWPATPFCVSYSPNTCVHQVKSRLESEHGIARTQIKVVCKGKVLHDAALVPLEPRTKLILVLSDAIATPVPLSDGKWRPCLELWLAAAQFRCGAEVYLERHTDTMVLERSGPQKSSSVTMTEGLGGTLHLRQASCHMSLAQLEKNLSPHGTRMDTETARIADRVVAASLNLQLSAVGEAGALEEDLTEGYSHAIQAFRARLATAPLVIPTPNMVS